MTDKIKNLIEEYKKLDAREKIYFRGNIHKLDLKDREEILENNKLICEKILKMTDENGKSIFKRKWVYSKFLRS